MPVLSSATTEYKFNKAEITKLIAADLGVPVEAIKVNFDITTEYSGGYPDDYGTKVVKTVTVTVDNTKLSETKNKNRTLIHD